MPYVILVWRFFNREVFLKSQKLFCGLSAQCIAVRLKNAVLPTFVAQASAVTVCGVIGALAVSALTSVALGSGDAAPEEVQAPAAPINSGSSAADKAAGRTAPEASPMTPVTPAPIANLQALLSEIKALNDAKKFSTAEKKARAIIEKDAGVSEAHNLLGFSLRNQKKYQESIQAYQDAIRINGNFAQAKEYLAISYLNMGEAKAAQALYDELKASHPSLAKLILTEAKKLKVKIKK